MNMKETMTRQGFVTIATGDEKYYILAFNLLRSYKLHCSEDKLPFAIICDRKNKYTEMFDDVVILEEASMSFMDKLLLYKYSPYEETIFIDADSLFIGSPEGLWDDFKNADDISCYGAPLPLNSTKGWFTYEGCREYKEQIKFLISLHGGVYFFRKTERARKIFEKAIDLAENYSKYGFNYFDKPADEPVMAMAMAIFQCQPYHEKQNGGIIFVPSCYGKVKIKWDGKITLKNQSQCTEVLCHFGTRNTELFVYKFAVYSNECDYYGKDKSARVLGCFRIKLLTLPQTNKTMLRHWGGQVIRKYVPNRFVKRLQLR